ncbi:MAG: ABC transporter substrate-binding protein [Thermodesulfobacteriota bacterium]
MRLKVLFAAIVFIVSGCPSDGAWAEQPALKEIPLGGVFDLTGPTSVLGRVYAQGAMDATAFLNQNGGINGQPLRLAAEDYASDPARAVALYRKFKSVDKVFVLQGWGAADTAALTPLVTKDRVVFLSASYDAGLADPRKAPYNFTIGATYSDQARLAMRWIKDNGGAKVCFVFPDHPFGREPLAAGKEMAKKLGLEIGPDFTVGLRATDAVPQLLRLKEYDPDFAWLGGTTPSAAVIVRDAARLKLKTRFVLNVWAMDETLAQIAGEAVDGRVFGFMVARPFGADIQAAADIRTVAGDRSYPHLYNQAWASLMVLAEGLKRAHSAGKLNGPGLKAALESLTDFTTGGLTPPLTYTSEDHRGTTACGLYTFKEGRLHLAADLALERNKEHLGW